MYLHISNQMRKQDKTKYCQEYTVQCLTNVGAHRKCLAVATVQKKEEIYIFLEILYYIYFKEWYYVTLICKVKAKYCYFKIKSLSFFNRVLAFIMEQPQKYCSYIINIRICWVPLLSRQHLYNYDTKTIYVWFVCDYAYVSIMELWWHIPPARNFV